MTLPLDSRCVIDYNDYINYFVQFIDDGRQENGTEGGKNLRVVGKGTRESRLDARLQELAGKGDWEGIVRTLDRYDENNERRHRSHRDDIDITIPERKADDEQDTYRISDMMRLCCWEDWLDIIFSQKPEDLHQLVEDTKVSRALKELTSQIGRAHV